MALEGLEWLDSRLAGIPVSIGEDSRPVRMEAVSGSRWTRKEILCWYSE